MYYGTQLCGLCSCRDWDEKLSNGNVLLSELMDHVLDAGTYTELNYANAREMMATYL